MIELVAAYSHLFRGARLTAMASEFPDPVRACQVVLSFSDGVMVEAELMTGATSGDSALAVPAYRTATGHPVAAAVWPVVEITVGDAADRVSIKIGPRLS